METTIDDQNRTGIDGQFLNDPATFMRRLEINVFSLIEDFPLIFSQFPLFYYIPFYIAASFAPLLTLQK
ncbi:hypothetical protein P8452_65029 [Trifolium repens]|nr:hypothetical protein P8452_65029 [Trifolium repens]